MFYTVLIVVHNILKTLYLLLLVLQLGREFYLALEHLYTFLQIELSALTIYDHIKSNLDVKIATDQRGTKFFNTKKYKYVLINVPNIFDKFYLLPLNVFRFFLSVIKSYFFLKKEKITKIVSTGGYMSFPFCLASVLLNCELILFEPNGVLHV